MTVRLVPLDPSQPTFGPYADVVSVTFTGSEFTAHTKDNGGYHCYVGGVYALICEEEKA